MIYLLGALIDPLVFLGVLLVPNPAARGAHGGMRPSGTPRIVLALVAAVALLSARVLLLGLAGGFFALVHVLYLEAVVAVPLAASGLLVPELVPAGWPLARRFPVGVRRMAFVGLLPAAVGIWASFVEPFRLVLEAAEIPLPPERAGSAAVTIGVLADIQTDRVTEHERRAVRRILAESPDIILIPGDLFQGSPEELARELPALRELLRELSAPGGVFFVTGNSDPPLSELRRAFDGSKVEILANEVREVCIRDRRIRIAGLDSGASRSGEHPLQAQFEKAPGEEDIRILVGHYPDMVLSLDPQPRIDLVVAGHTHGGQVCLPWFGPPLTLTRVPRRVAAGGYHRLEGRDIYVSRGVGVERAEAPRIRFLCRPEVSLLTLR